MKKKVLISLILFNFFDIVHAENALSCGTYKNIPVGLPGFFRGIMTIIKYIVPLILIMFASMDIVKIIYSQKKENMDEMVRKIVLKFVAAVSVFFVTVLVQAIVKEASGDSDLALCISCFTVDSTYCSSYEVDADNSSAEKSVADAEREALEKEREEKRKVAEEEATDAKKVASNDNDPKNIRDGSYSGSSGKSKNPGTKNIIVGDSRTVGMCAQMGGDYSSCTYWGGSGKVVNGDIYICRSAMEYNWFASTAVPAVNQIIADNPGTRYNIFSLMGVNWLLAHIDKYITKYNELAEGDWKDQNIILVSANPVDEAKERLNGYSTKNVDIETFNTKLREGTAGKDNITFCDTYNAAKNGLNTSDGLHYNLSTTQVIYNGMMGCV